MCRAEAFRLLDEYMEEHFPHLGDESENTETKENEESTGKTELVDDMLTKEIASLKRKRVQHKVYPAPLN